MAVTRPHRGRHARAMNPQHTASPAFEPDALIADAERRERMAADALGDARAAHANARESARLARDTRDRAAAIEADARAAHANAAARAEEVERAWQLDQTDARWAAVEAARSMRDQAELRARQAAGSVQRADADVALAERRLAAADAHEAEAARDHRGAEDVLAGHRSAWQCRSADEARRRGEELRREGEWRRDRDAWQAALDDELGAALLGYLRAVQALREAEGEVERVRSSLAGRVESINLRGPRPHPQGLARPPPAGAAGGRGARAQGVPAGAGGLRGRVAVRAAGAGVGALGLGARGPAPVARARRERVEPGRRHGAAARAGGGPRRARAAARPGRRRGRAGGAAGRGGRGAGGVVPVPRAAGLVRAARGVSGCASRTSPPASPGATARRGSACGCGSSASTTPRCRG